MMSFDFLGGGYMIALLGIAACIVLAAAFPPFHNSAKDQSQDKVAFYFRYSSINQRGDSIDDQRRNSMEYLDRHGIDYSDSIELSDAAATGMTNNRNGFKSLLNLVKREELDLVVVDDLSRLTRAKDLGVLWDTLKIHRCRLISAIDGIDSAREGDEVGAMLKGIMNNITNKMNGRRIRRGLVGRVLDEDASYGAHPYGYTSVFADPGEAAKYSGIGPKPKKNLEINPEEAAVVLEVFQRYGEQEQSASEIARELNSREVPLGNRSNRKNSDGTTYHTGWTKSRVVTMLRQVKYIGDWRWGEFTHEKDLDGKRITREVENKADIVRVDRPKLRIVPQDLWDKVQARLDLMRDKHGVKEGQRKRGYRRSHCSEDYPFRISRGLLFCGSCGSGLQLTGGKNGPGPYYKCPVASCGGKSKGIAPCAQHGTVHAARAEQALLDFLRKQLVATPQWLDSVYTTMTIKLREMSAQSPDRQRLLEQEHAELNRKIENLTKALAEGTGSNPKSVLGFIDQYELRKVSIESELSKLKKRASAIEALPSKSQMKKLLSDLTTIFDKDEDVRAASQLLKLYFGKIEAHSIVAPGKIRGYMELRFHPSNSRLVESIVAPNVPGLDFSTNTVIGNEVRLALSSRNDKLDRLIPTIHAMRMEGKTWREIEKKLKIHRGWANKYYRIWLKETELSTHTLDTNTESTGLMTPPTAASPTNDD